MTISFTNSVGYTRSFSTNELTIVITNLNATNSYYTNGLNDLLYVRVKEGYLLLFDLTDNINRKIFESFSIGYDASNPFSLKFTHNSTAIEYTVDNALTSVGFSGTTPISTLESQYMKLYVTTSSLSYLTTNDIVKDVGQHSVSPAEIKTFVGTNGIVLSNDANDFTISFNASNIADGDLTIAKTNGLQTQLNTANNGVLANLASIQGLTTDVASKVDSSLFTSTVNSLDSAILQNEADILLKANQSTTYTKVEVQGFLNTKADDGDLLQINTTGTTYQQITHLAFDGGSVALSNSNTLATVTLPSLEVKYNTAWIEATKLEFMNHTVSTNTNPTRVEITATPAVSDVVGLQSDLDDKANQSTTYTKTEVDALKPQVKYSGAYVDFSELEFTNSLLSLGTSAGQYSIVSQPNLSDIQGWTVSGNNVTFPGSMTLQNIGDVVLTLKADTDNSGEGDNPLLRFQQDGTVVYTDMGLSEVGNTFYINWGADGTTNSQYFEIQHGGVRDFEIDRWSRAKFYDDLTVVADCYAVSFTTTSDQSVKDDVKDIDLTPVFDNCNVKSYLRTDKPEWDRRIGFIAQDIQKACTDNNLPNTFNRDIHQEDDTTLLGLDYSRLVTVLWSKVKQLEQRIAVLES